MKQVIERSKKIPAWLWIEIVVFLLAQYLICTNISLMGDDYMYGTFGKQDTVSHVFAYWNTGNGRWLVNLIDSILCSNSIIYNLGLPWLLLLLSWLIFRLVAVLSEKDDITVFGLAMVLITCIDVLMTREVFYWITGAMNYLIPAVLFLAAAIYTVQINNNILSHKKAALGAGLCVLSCLTMEQFALMSLGWMTLIWGKSFFRGSKRISKTQLITFALSLVAFCTIMFAPANSIRLEDASAKGNSLIVKAWDLLYYDYSSKVGAVFIFLLAGYGSFLQGQSGNKTLAVVSAINALIVLFFYDYCVIDLPGWGSIPFLFISILSLLCVYYGIVQKQEKNKRYYLICLLLLSAGSQIILLKTDLWGFRTSFSWILIWIVFLMLIMDNSEESKAAIVVLVAFSVNIILGVLVLAISIATWKKEKRTVIVMLFLCGIILWNTRDEINGYRENSAVHLYNAEEAMSAVGDNGGKSVVLRPYIDAQYGWNNLPFSEFHEQYFRQYYDIPNDVVILYQ